MAVNYINLADIDRGLQQAQLGDMQIQNQRDLQTDRAFARNQQEQANQQQMRIRDIYAGAGGDLSKARTELYNQGFYEQGGTIDKQLGDQSKQKSDIDKTTLETNAKRIGLIGNGMKFLIDNPTKENALMTFNQLKSTGVMPQDMYDQLMSKLPDDPAMIKQGAEVLFRSALDAKDQLAKFETRDTGGQVMTQQIDPITGQVKTVGTIAKTQSPDSIASNALTRRGQDITVRGQNMTDSRARDKNEIDAAAGGYSNKPLPATALKMQNEGLDKLAIASNNNSKLANVVKQIDDGKLNLGLTSNLVGPARTSVGPRDDSTGNLSSFKST